MGEEEEIGRGRHDAVYEVQVTRVLCRAACVVLLWKHRGQRPVAREASSWKRKVEDSGT